MNLSNNGLITHALVFCVGSVIGCFVYAVVSNKVIPAHSLDFGSVPVVKKPQQAIEYQDTEENEVAVNNKLSQKGSEFLTAAEIVSRLETLDDKAYREFRSGDEGGSRRLFANESVALDVLRSLTEISDKRTQWRIHEVLRLETWSSLREQHWTMNETPIEAWVMNEIHNYRRRDVWLEALGQIGIYSVDNMEYLVSELPNFQSDHNVQNVLNGLGSRHTPLMDFSNAAWLSSLSLKTRTYLEHDDEVVRAAAVKSLRVVRDNSVVREQLLEALKDPSQKVQEQAARVIANQHLKSPEIKKRLLFNMSNQVFSDRVRASAAQTLRIFALTPDEHEKVSTFSSNELPRIFRELSGSSPWDD